MKDQMFLSDVAPYGLAPDAKRAFLVERLAELTAHHRNACAPYRAFTDEWQWPRQPARVEEIPYLPVTAFKEFDLRSSSGPGLAVRSSATTGVSSQIFVDKETRKRQHLSASRILADFAGAERRPYIVFDLESTVRGSDAMSARGAAILSVGHLASEFLFVMRDTGGGLEPDPDALARALELVGERPFVAYGFTYMLYQAHEWLDQRGWRAQAHPDSLFLHSGGWKRLQASAVDKPAFNARVGRVWGLPPDRVVDFYGLVEQVGVPYPDCAAGHKHVPYWADIVIRRADTLEAASVGEVGLIQLLNCLPLSAPNHSVLTEDLGAIVAEDGCACGRRGKAFVFKGRAPAAEVRGCSDVVRH
jgi:hypothetical protein